MALHEESVRYARFGHVVTANLASYTSGPTPTSSTSTRSASWAAAAVVDDVYDATGVRVRDLPVTLDTLLPDLS